MKMMNHSGRALAAESKDRDAALWILLGLAPIVAVWELNGFYLIPLTTLGLTWFWVVDCIQWILLPAGVLIWLARNQAIKPSRYGFGPTGLGVLAFNSILVLGTSYSAMFAAEQIGLLVFGSPSDGFSLPDMYPEGWARVPVWVYSAVSAGLVESVFFIGLPWLAWVNFRRDPSPVLFSIIASVVFGFAHWEQGAAGVTSAVAFNLAGCAWYFRIKSLWPIAFAHTAIDLIAFA